MIAAMDERLKRRFSVSASMEEISKIPQNKIGSQVTLFLRPLQSNPLNNITQLAFIDYNYCSRSITLPHFNLKYLL